MLSGAVLLCGPANAQFDRPVTAINVSPDGVYDAGFMCWYVPAGIFLHPAELVLLCTVKRVESQLDDVDSRRGTFWAGELEVARVVRCPDHLAGDAARIRTLECRGGFDGLVVGDTVVAFLAQYEGQYAMPARIGTNSTLGYKFPAKTDSGLFESGQFVELLSHPNAWDLASLTPNQLRLWASVDPHGVAEALIRVREWTEGSPADRK
jgi:hypothetical protein